MFWISVTTFNGKKKDFNLIDEQLAAYYFSKFIQATDAKNVYMCDGLTGEVLNAWEDGKLTVLNGVCI